MRSEGFVKVFMLIVIVLLLGVVGFLTKDYLPFGFIEIAQINKSPNKFEGQQVKVKGEVVDRLKIPFFDSKSYVIDDGTGRATVVTNAALPEIGSNVAIIALGSNTAIIGGESIGFRLQEIKVLPETALFPGK
jgi:hypothetical protein